MSQLQRVDTMDKHFKPVKILEKWSTVLFWINIVLSLGIVFLNSYPKYKEWFNIIFIVVTLCFFILSQLLSLWILPKAQSHRSTHLIANALGVALDNETTNLYYNNNQPPSIKRLGMNVFENSLFSMRVTEKMLILERIKVGIYFIGWICLIVVRSSSIDLISVLAQTLFATSLISDYLRIEIARIHFNRIYDKFWHLFLNSSVTPQATGIILNLVNQYEATKTSLPISINTEIFHKINNKVTQEWKDTKVRLDIQ